MKQTWTSQEIQYLTSSWGKVELSEIMATLQRTADSISRKARRLGIDIRKKEEEKLIKQWTEEEDDYLIENYGIISLKEMSKHIDRTANAISKRAAYLKISDNIKRWTKEEENYLEEKWGIVSVESIAKFLNRSRNSILLKAFNMNLKEQISANGAFLTPADICKILSVNLRTLYTWIREGKIKHKKFKVGNKRKYQITPESLCEFMEQNQDKWDSQKADMSVIKSYFTSYLISPNEKLTIKDLTPKWLEDKICRDKEGFKDTIKQWTTKEEIKLMEMKTSNLSFKYIAKQLDRSVFSVKTKYYMLTKNVVFA